MSRRIAIVGAGQSGLQLGLGLLGAGHDVTLVSNRTAEQLATGQVQSSQCMFESALETERALGLDFWSEECPPVEGIALAVPAADGSGAKAIDWAARLDGPAQSVDQRLKLSGWLGEYERRGGRLVLREAGVDDVERLARDHDLVVVATGKGELGGLFARDVEKSPYDTPQRALALTYVRGMEPRPAFSAVCFNLIPGVGEYFVFPALTTNGPCEIMVFEGVIGGPMDCWADVLTPEEHLARSLEILERFLPWEHARSAGVELTDPGGILTGRFAPTVRHPVARLPSGAFVLAMADAAVLNDPITGQGSNNAAKCAEIYLERVLAHDDDPFDERWMQQTFDHYWRGYAQWVVSWTNAVLAPPQPHVLQLLEAAQEIPALAATIANGFDDPRTFYPWWFDEHEAGRLIETKRLQDVRGLDVRGLRHALGQFATGVTVVTTRDAAGRRHRELVHVPLARAAARALVPRPRLLEPRRVPRLHVLRRQRALRESAPPLAAVRDARGREVRRVGRRAGRAVRHAAPRGRARPPRLPSRPPARGRRPRDPGRRDRELRGVRRGAARLPLRLVPGHHAPPRPLARGGTAGSPTGPLLYLCGEETRTRRSGESAVSPARTTVCVSQIDAG
jgi:hypothetical protein